eukprot:9260852-Prorocentrum_lima.AAC.1
MKAWQGWQVAHHLAVLPDAENYHLPLLGRLVSRVPPPPKVASLPTEDHVLAASLRAFSSAPLSVDQSLPLAQ